MPAKKIIAVIGATGAQGGGLVRAIAADRDGPFAARADHAQARVGQGARARRARASRSSPATPTIRASLDRAFAGRPRRLLRHELLGALLRGARDRASRRHGAGHEEGRAPARRLVDARGHAPARAARGRAPADAAGQVQVPALRFQGRGRRRLRRRGGADHVLARGVLLGELHLLRHGAAQGPDGDLVLALPLGGARLPGIAAGDIGKCAYGVFRRGAETVGQAHRRSRARSSPARRWRPRWRTRSGSKVEFTDMPFDVYRGLGFPGAEDLGNMFQYQAHSRRRVPQEPRPRALARAESRSSRLRRLARGQRRAHPDRVMPARSFPFRLSTRRLS